MDASPPVDWKVLPYEQYLYQLYLAILRDIVARDDVKTLLDIASRLLMSKDRRLSQALVPFGRALVNTSKSPINISRPNAGG